MLDKQWKFILFHYLLSSFTNESSFIWGELGQGIYGMTPTPHSFTPF